MPSISPSPKPCPSELRTCFDLPKLHTLLRTHFAFTPTLFFCNTTISFLIANLLSQRADPLIGCWKIFHFSQLEENHAAPCHHTRETWCISLRVRNKPRNDDLISFRWVFEGKNINYMHFMRWRIWWYIWAELDVGWMGGIEDMYYKNGQPFETDEPQHFLWKE